MKHHLLYFSLAAFLSSCQNNPVDAIQGTFEVDKSALKVVMQHKVKSDNLLATALLNKILENAVIELKVSGDSIQGLMFLAGQSTLVNGVIQVQNDTMTVKSGEFNAVIIPNELGFVMENKSTNVEMVMLKSKAKDLSANTKAAIGNAVEKAKEIAEFNETLGRWQEGNYVDEFGDRTSKPFAFCIVKGSHENSSVVASNVYVKAIVDDGKVYFQIFNESFTMKETFPKDEFGIIKIKFTAGNVKSERVFLHDNIVSEAPHDDNPIIFNHLLTEESELKVLFDVSSASNYHSDKYQFSISRNNLSEIQTKIN